MLCSNNIKTISDMTKATKTNAVVCTAFFAALVWMASTHEQVNNLRTYDRMPIETREYVYNMMQPTNVDTTTNSGKSTLIEFWKDNLPAVTEWEMENGVCW